MPTGSCEPWPRLHQSKGGGEPVAEVGQGKSGEGPTSVGLRRLDRVPLLPQVDVREATGEEGLDEGLDLRDPLGWCLAPRVKAIPYFYVTPTGALEGHLEYHKMARQEARQQHLLVPPVELFDTLGRRFMVGAVAIIQELSKSLGQIGLSRFAVGNFSVESAREASQAEEVHTPA